MNADVMVLSAVAFLLLVFTIVGGPMIAADWQRKRQEAVIARQIALTDALDGRLGAVVAPVVLKPLFGPWEVRIAMPFLRSTVLARMLSLIDDVFAGGKAAPASAYRIILTVAPDMQRTRTAHGLPGPGKKWVHTPVGAA